MDEWNKELLNEIENYSQELPKMTKKAQKNIADMLHKRLKEKRTTAFADRKNRRRRKRKPIRIIVAVAAIVCVATATVVVAGDFVAKMGKGNNIDFLEDSRASTKQSMKKDLESFSSIVGQTEKDGNISVTLDSIAADANIINAFFTVASSEAIDLVSKTENYAGAEKGDPEWYLINNAAPDFFYEIKGLDIGGQNNLTDNPTDILTENLSGKLAEKVETYMPDEKTIKAMVRIVPTSVLPDSFTLSIKAFGALNFQNNFIFETDVDISEVSRGGIAVPQVLSFERESGAAVGVEKLELSKLAATSFGISLSAKDRYSTVDGAMGPTKGYIPVKRLYITDDKGNVLSSKLDNRYLGRSYAEEYRSVELLGGDNTTKSLTFTPLSYKDIPDNEKIDEKMTLNVEDVGQKIETSGLGGFIYKGCEIIGSEIQLKLEPYGFSEYVELIPDDDNVTTRDGHTALVNVKQDYKTGEVIYSLSYYAATPEELAEIKSFTYHKSLFLDESCLDKSAAITVTLE